MAPTDVFHDGEKAVQERAGVRGPASKLGPRMVQSELPTVFADFLASVPFIYVAAPAPDDHIWVSVLGGRPGFAHAVSPTHIEIDVVIPPEDPLTVALAGRPAQLGMLVIEPMTRSRVRLNGIARPTSRGLTLQLRECFGNCPKYIQRRYPVALAPPPAPGTPATTVSDRLQADEQALIAAADTFVIGSRHPDRGADASHRGGRPGFVAGAPDGRSLTFPDYPGNMMFQTLGNLTSDPTVGLLFVDWETGRTLQIAGQATIDWGSQRLAGWERAERLIDVSIEQVIDRPAGLPVVWELVEAHRLNPAVPEPSARVVQPGGQDASERSPSAS
jgi:uncharacterized protein